jgi:hypothetical protein
MATIDTSKLTYKYVLQDDNSVDYTADADGRNQNLSGLDVSSQKNLERSLDDYTRNYVAGLNARQDVAASGLTVGKTVNGNAAETE